MEIRKTTSVAAVASTSPVTLFEKYRYPLTLMMHCMFALAGAIATSLYVSVMADISVFIKASIPSMGLFQIANLLFWAVIFFNISEK